MINHHRVKRRSFLPSLALNLLAVCGLFLFPSGLQARAEDLKVEARLVWGTNDPKSPDSKHKALDTSLSRKLGKIFKWRNYFEVNQKEVTIPMNVAKKIQMSDKCMLEVRNLGGNRVEVKLYGSGKLVNRTEQNLRGDWLTIAGDSENNTAWFVVLKLAD